MFAAEAKWEFWVGRDKAWDQVEISEMAARLKTLSTSIRNVS